MTLVAHKVGRLIKGIPLPDLDASQLLNGHFVDDSFLTILVEKESMDKLTTLWNAFKSST